MNVQTIADVILAELDESQVDAVGMTETHALRIASAIVSACVNEIEEQKRDVIDRHLKKLDDAK